MPIRLTYEVGASGILADVDPKKLPDGAWSDGENVRFDGFVAKKVGGSREVFGSLSAAAYSLIPHTNFDGSPFFCYAGLTSVYTVSNDTHYDLTRQSATTSGTLTNRAYSADATELWTGGVFGGLLFLNNGADAPQIQLTPTASARLADLPNWPTTVTTRCASLRAFKNFLVALDVTKGAQRYRQMVKWSSSADPLSVPASWDESLTTTDAGETSLADTDGTVIDCLPLRDINVVYKDDSIYGMQYIGGAFVFRFYQIFSKVGLLARRCVAAFEQYHCFVGSDLDIYVHDGTTVRSIGQDKWRDWLRANIDGTNYQRCFVVPNPTTTEIWICVPTGEQDYCSKVLMWNWRKDTWGVRTISNVSSGAVGAIRSSNYITLWSTIATTWDTETQTWAELSSVPPDKRLVLASPGNTNGLIETEIGTSELGAALPFYLERTGLWANPLKIDNNARVIDLQSVKFVRRIRFRTTATNSNNITYKVALQSDVDSPLVWVSTSKMINSTAEVVVLKRGRFLNIRVESTEDIDFNLHAIEVEAEVSGMYL